MNTTNRSSARTLYIATAVLVFLSGVLPVNSYDDRTLFSAGAMMVVPLLMMTAMLLLAGTSSNGGLSALGGGAGVAVAGFLGGIMVPSWAIAKGEGFAVGAWVATAASIVAVFAAARGIATLEAGQRHRVNTVAVVAGVVMSIGTTLVPPDVADNGTNWAQWNFFSEFFPTSFAIGAQMVVWSPAIALALAMRGGSRAGVLFGLAGAAPVTTLLVMAQIGILDSGVDGFGFRPKLHPVAIVGAIAVAAVLVVGLGVTKAAASAAAVAAAGEPPRSAEWAPDPMGRYAYRLWNGSAWTDQVSDGGSVSIDPGPVTLPQAPVAAPVPPPAPPQVQPPVPPPTVQVPVVSPPPPVATPPSPWSPTPSQTASYEATVDRTVVRGGPTGRNTFSVMLDDGRTTHVNGFAIVGRGPTPRPTDAPATLVVVEDPTLSVSKSHLAVGCDDVGLWIQDRGSTNGSTYTVPGGTAVAAQPEVQHRVPAGTRVDIGDRWLHLQ